MNEYHMNDSSYPEILVAAEYPPKNYLNALSRVNLSFDCSLSPENPSIYKGLLLIGGGDILPAYYGGNIPSYNVNFVKDKLEFDIAAYPQKSADTRHLPRFSAYQRAFGRHA